MERPDPTALADLYAVPLGTRPQGPHPERSRIATAWSWLVGFFSEQNFAEQPQDLKPARDHRIRLMHIVLEGATRLNGRTWSWRRGPALNLAADEIVIVLCETIRILMVENKVMAFLNTTKET